MSKNMSATNQAELTPLRELSARIGSDPLLTQASTGNSSIKLAGVLWMKASGKWMADAIHEDILIPWNTNLMVYAGNGFRTCPRVCLLPARSKRFCPPPPTPTSWYWATTVWSSEEMTAAPSKISYLRYGSAWPFIPERRTRPTTLG